MKNIIVLLFVVLSLVSCKDKKDSCYLCSYSIDYVNLDQRDTAYTLNKTCIIADELAQKYSFGGHAGESYRFEVQETRQKVYDKWKRDSAYAVFICIED